MGGRGRKGFNRVGSRSANKRRVRSYNDDVRYGDSDILGLVINRK